MSLEALFQPHRLNATLALANRIVVAPCTRNRALLPDMLPTPGAVPYYAARAGAGLVITEAVMITREVQGYRDTPGIWSDEQRERWRDVATAVHRAGGFIFMQLWHTGRLAHSSFTGEQPVAPSPVPTYLEPRSTRGVPLSHETPRALSVDEIHAKIADFAHAARNARAAGFDGVELHGANGYLIDQFLRQHTNRRTDEWGGSAVNRARFALAIVDAVAAEIGYDRVAIRLSPAAYFGDMRYVAGDEAASIHLLEALSERSIAYVHTGIVVDRVYDEIGSRASAFLRRHFRGAVIGNGGYTAERAAEAVRAGEFDLVSFGKAFIANPDLVDKLRHGVSLTPYVNEMTYRFE